MLTTKLLVRVILGLQIAQLGMYALDRKSKVDMLREEVQALKKALE